VLTLVLTDRPLSRLARLSRFSAETVLEQSCARLVALRLAE